MNRAGEPTSDAYFVARKSSLRVSSRQPHKSGVARQRCSHSRVGERHLCGGHCVGRPKCETVERVGELFDAEVYNLPIILTNKVGQLVEANARRGQVEHLAREIVVQLKPVLESPR